jgi:4-hydroxybenzoyl-CoA thioesterase
MSHRPRFEKPFRVPFSACDAAGIMFFPQYLIQFQGLVEDWVTDSLGISYASLFWPRRLGLPTVRLETDYRTISRMGDEVILGLEVEHLGTKSLILALDCRDESRVRVATRQVIVATDLDTHTSIVIPDDVRAAIARFMSPVSPAGDTR